MGQRTIGNSCFFLWAHALLVASRVHADRWLGRGGVVAEVCSVLVASGPARRDVHLINPFKSGLHMSTGRKRSAPPAGKIMAPSAEQIDAVSGGGGGAIVRHAA